MSYLLEDDEYAEASTAVWPVYWTGALNQELSKCLRHEHGEDAK